MTVKKEIDEFNAVPSHKTYANSRLVASGANEPQIVDAKDLGLRERDKLDLINLFREPERKLNALKVTDCFEEAFFKTNFWLMWGTM